MLFYFDCKVMDKNESKTTFVFKTYESCYRCFL